MERGSISQKLTSRETRVALVGLAIAGISTLAEVRPVEAQTPEAKPAPKPEATKTLTDTERHVWAEVTAVVQRTNSERTATAIVASADNIAIIGKAKIEATKTVAGNTPFNEEDWLEGFLHGAGLVGETVVGAPLALVLGGIGGIFRVLGHIGGNTLDWVRHHPVTTGTLFTLGAIGGYIEVARRRAWHFWPFN